MTMREKIVSNLEEKIRILKDESGREPAGDQNVRIWIKSMIPKLEVRLQNLKTRKW